MSPLPENTGPEQATEALRESEELFSKAFWLSPDCVALARAADGTLIKVNAALCSFWHTTPDEAIGKTLEDFSTWPNEEERLDFNRALAENGECLNYEATLRMNDGRLVTFKLSSRLITLNHESCILNLRHDITEERRIERALKVSELRYRRLFETAKDGILILDAGTGMVMDVNPFLVELLGFSHEQFLGKAIWDLGFFKDVVANEAKFTELSIKGYVRYESLPLETKDGRRIEVEFVSNVYLVNGEKVIQCNIRDVTTRRQAEEAMRRQETELRVLFDLMPAMIWFKDTENNHLRVNQRAAESIGKPVAELEGKPAREIYPKEADAFYAADLEVIHSGKPKLGIVETIHDQNGQQLWVQTDKVPYCDENGKVIGIVVMAQDITKRKLADAALSESELRYHTLFENMLEGYAFCRLLYDEQGQASDFVYLEVNSAFESLSGLKDVVGKKVSELIPGIRESTPELFEAYSRAASTGKTERFETHLPALERWFSVTVYSNKKEHFVAVFENITERKRMEARLRRLVDSNAQGVFFWNTKGEITVANDAFLKLTGYTREDLEAGLINWVAMTPPEYAHLDRHALDELAASGICSLYEKVWIRKDGSLVPILLGAAMFEDNPDDGVCFAIDITKRIQAEDELRESRHFAESIAENSPSIIYLYDFKTRRTVYTNRNAGEALGYSKAQIIAMGEKFLPTVVHPKDMHQIVQQAVNFKDALDGSIFDLELRMKHANGDWRWLWNRETIFNRY
ncbi:MAG: PAS domain S-box protein, partial [Pseudoxanthomonas sp.]